MQGFVHRIKYKLDNEVGSQAQWTVSVKNRLRFNVSPAGRAIANLVKLNQD